LSKLGRPAARGERTVRQLPASACRRGLLPRDARTRRVSRDDGGSGRQSAHLHDGLVHAFDRLANARRRCRRGGVPDADRGADTVIRGRQPLGEDGQALVESSLLLAAVVGALAVGGLWLMRTHPGLLQALDAQLRGFYFALSL